MQKAIIYMILISIFMLFGYAFALQNSCQHGIIIKIIPQSEVDIDDDIGIVEMKSSGVSLAPNDMINEKSIPLNVYRQETSGYFGKITAELDKNYNFGMNFRASCDNKTQSERKWKELNASACNLLSGIKNNGGIQSSISYEISIPNSQIIPGSEIITVILTVTDDENLYNRGLPSREFYSYEEFRSIYDGL